MKTPKFLNVIIASTFVMVASTIAALAVPATATTGVNVRSGPGTNFAVVDTLHAGQAVNVTECQGGWCYVEKPGPDGWVSGNYLQATEAPPPNNSAANDAAAAAAINVFGTIAAAVIGNIVTPPVVPAPQICFFDGANYTGASFCVDAGTSNTQLAGFWNDRISSVTVPAGSTVTVCRNASYGGPCRTYNADRAFLHALVNNKVTSFQTF